MVLRYGNAINLYIEGRVEFYAGRQKIQRIIESKRKAPEAAREVLTINVISLHIAIELRLPVATRKSDLLEAQESMLKCKVNRVKEVPLKQRVKLFDQKDCYNQEDKPLRYYIDSPCD